VSAANSTTFCCNFCRVVCAQGVRARPPTYEFADRCRDQNCVSASALACAEKALRRAAASEGCLYDDAASVTSATTTMSLSEWGVDDGDQSPVDAALELMQVQPNLPVTLAVNPHLNQSNHAAIPTRR